MNEMKNNLSIAVRLTLALLSCADMAEEDNSIQNQLVFFIVVYF